jgi:hypothetical protein
LLASTSRPVQPAAVRTIACIEDPAVIKSTPKDASAAPSRLPPAGRSGTTAGGFVLIEPPTRHTPPVLTRKGAAWQRSSSPSESVPNGLRLGTISRLGRLGFRPISRRTRVDGCLTTGGYSRDLGKAYYVGQLGLTSSYVVKVKPGGMS